MLKFAGFSLHRRVARADLPSAARNFPPAPPLHAFLVHSALRAGAGDFSAK